MIVPKKAVLVRRIFRMYLEGLSSMKIAECLTVEGIPTVTGKRVWHATVIHKMLSNEKYKGDALLQKTYTTDFLTKKRVKNNGIVPQYYIEGNHEAIIPRELFYKVQEEKARKKDHKGKSGSPRQIQFPIRFIRHHDLQGMRPAVPQTSVGQQRS